MRENVTSCVNIPPPIKMDCSDFRAEAKIRLPTDLQYQDLLVECSQQLVEFCGRWELPVLTFSVKTPPLCGTQNEDPCLKSDPIMNKKTSIQFNITKRANASKDVDENKLFSFYKQTQSYFDNKDIHQSQFQSIGFPSDNTMIVQINSILLNETSDVWQLFPSSYNQTLYFSCDLPQFYPKAYTTLNYTFFYVIEIRDDQLWTVITKTPVSLLTGLAKIGGFLSLFTAIRFLLSYLHQRVFFKDLKESTGKKDIQSDFSYERL